MFSQTVIVERDHLDPLCSVLKALAGYFGSVYELEEKIELTVRTEDPCFADTIRAMLKDKEPVTLGVKDPVKEAVKASVNKAFKAAAQEPESIGANQTPGVVFPIVTILPPGIRQSTVEPHDGLVACDVKEREVICKSCGKPFIRTHKLQKYCKKPECQRAALRAPGTQKRNAKTPSVSVETEQPE